MDGILLINKPQGLTSFDVCYKIKRKFKVKKVGHGGTLDPFATGLLIVGINKGTRILNFFSEADKEYSGTIVLGEKRDTYDITGNVFGKKSFKHITKQDILNIRDKFVGSIKQKPPAFSAVKHKGKSLYKYARKGIAIEKEARDVFIEKFDIIKINLPEIDFRIKCSKGTYIRSIANDLGEKLDCYGYLSKLKREEIGNFKVDNAFDLEDIKTDDIIPFGEALNFKKLFLNETYKKYLENGQDIKLDFIKNLDFNPKNGENVYITCDNIIAIGYYNMNNESFKLNIVHRYEL